MMPKQFMLYLLVKRIGENDIGEQYEYFQCLEIDIVSENVSDFLARIPNDINETSILWASITRQDDKTISFADGIELNGERLSGGRADDDRYQAKLFAERRLKRVQNKNDA